MHLLVPCVSEHGDAQEEICGALGAACVLWGLLGEGGTLCALCQGWAAAVLLSLSVFSWEHFLRHTQLLFPQLCPSLEFISAGHLTACVRGHAVIHEDSAQETASLSLGFWELAIDMSCASSPASGCSSVGQGPISSAHFPCNPEGANPIKSVMYLWFRDNSLWFSALFQSMSLRKGFTRWFPSKLDLQHKRIQVCAWQNQHFVPC